MANITTLYYGQYKPIIVHTDVLQQLGLAKNEARIYEALVGLGPANISEISSISKVNRRNVYDSIQHLVAKGLVIQASGFREKRYQATAPSKLGELLETQKANLLTILPTLQATYKTKTPDEQAFIARGTEGIKNYWRYVLTQSGPSLFVGGKGAWHDPQIERERQRYFSGCRKKGIIIQGIFDQEMRDHGYDVYSQYDPGWIRFFPKGFSTNATYDICGDRVLLFVMPREKDVFNATLFNIVSTSIADSFRTWFQFLWQLSEPLEKHD